LTLDRNRALSRSPAPSAIREKFQSTQVNSRLWVARSPQLKSANVQTQLQLTVAQGKRNSKRRAAKRSKVRRSKSTKPDRLMSQLEDAEEALQRWIGKSPANRSFFRRDPIGAMRKAGLDIDDDILLELEIITSAIAKKLK
jgi:hypothetical protein